MTASNLTPFQENSTISIPTSANDITTATIGDVTYYGHSTGTIDNKIYRVSSAYDILAENDRLKSEQREAAASIAYLQNQLKLEHDSHLALIEAHRKLQDVLMAAVQVITTFMIGSGVIDYGIEHSLKSMTEMEMNKAVTSEDAEVKVPSLMINAAFLKNHYLPGADEDQVMNQRLKTICEQFSTIMMDMKKIAQNLNNPELLESVTTLHACSLEEMILHQLGYEVCGSYTNFQKFHLRPTSYRYRYVDNTMRAVAVDIATQMNKFIQDKINGQENNRNNTTEPTAENADRPGESPQGAYERINDANSGQAGEAPRYSDSEAGTGYTQQ
jgi:hypothetical protein